MASVVKTVEIDILAKDGDAQAKLDAISAKADELREMHPELTVRIDTAEATAKMAVLREEIKEATKSVDVEIKPKLDKHALAESEAEMGILSRILYGSDFGGGGGGGGEVGGLAGLAPELSPLVIVLGALIPLFEAAAVELAALAAGFAAAAAGAGAFAASWRSPARSDREGIIRRAQADTQAQLKKLSPDDGRQDGGSTRSRSTRFRSRCARQSPKTEYEGMSKAFEPIVFKNFNDALKIENSLLPTLQPSGGQLRQSSRSRTAS